MSTGVFSLNTGEPVRSVRSRRLTDGEKVDAVLKLIQKWGWTLGDLLHKLFQAGPLDSESSMHRDGQTEREAVRRGHISQFLSGNSSTGPISFVVLMYDHPYARPASNHPESERYFADNVEAAEIKYAKPALSTWALEVTIKEMRRESNYLISKRAGL